MTMSHTTIASEAGTSRLRALFRATRALASGLILSSGKNEGPPDLDELWRDFNRKLSGLFGGKGGASKGVGSGDNNAGDQASADAGTFHVGLKIRPATATTPAVVVTRPNAHRRTALAPEQATELAIEVAPEFVEIWRAFVLAAAQNQAGRQRARDRKSVV